MTTDCSRSVCEHFVHRTLVQLVGNKRVLCSKSVCTVCVFGLNMYFFQCFCSLRNRVFLMLGLIRFPTGHILLAE